MPHINGIHDEKNQSLQQRVDIVIFPHVYTNDIEKIRGEPNKYKQINVTIKDTLKGKDQALYRRVFFDILIEHLKQYQQDKSEGKDRELPEALKRIRAQYFADCDAVKMSFFDTFEKSRMSSLKSPLFKNAGDVSRQVSPAELPGPPPTDPPKSPRTPSPLQKRKSKPNFHQEDRGEVRS